MNFTSYVSNRAGRVAPPTMPNPQSVHYNIGRMFNAVNATVFKLRIIDLSISCKIFVGGSMKTVKLEVRCLDDSLADLRRAWAEDESDDCARIAFESPELLWRVLTAKRWALLKAMTGAGALSIREAARRVERDVKAVHTDVHALLNAGIVNKTDAGKIEFPYDTVHVDFTLHAAA